MKILVFGGTGDVGKEIVTKLLKEGKYVSVLTRQMMDSTEKLKYITGNVLDYNTVENCIEETDQVIITLGFNNSDADTMSRGTKNILTAMKIKNSKRLICLSAQGAGDSWKYMPDEFKEMVKNDPVLKASFHDHSLQEEFVKASNLEWTIVRPTEIMDTPEAKTFARNRPNKESVFQISKYDVAQFIIDELTSVEYLHQAVMITN